MSIKVFAAIIILFSGTPINTFANVQWADIRHIGDSLVDARPSVEEFHSFNSKIDLDDDWEDLQEEYDERAKRLTQMESASIKNLPIGRRFKIHQEMLSLINQQITYNIFKRDHNFSRTYQKWLIELTEDKPKRESKELRSHKLKGLEIARTMANDYKKLEPEISEYQLIKFYILNNNENFSFYFKKFKKRYPKSQKLAEILHLVGEYHFANKKWSQANQTFKEALAIKSSLYRPYTAYMMGWSSLLEAKTSKKTSTRLKAHKTANTAFKFASKLAKDWDEFETPYSFKKQFAYDLAWYWADQKTAIEKVLPFFKEINQEWAVQEFYYYQGVLATNRKSPKEAQQWFTKVLKNSSTSKEHPRYALKSLESKIILKQYNQLKEAFSDLKKIGHEDSDWVDEWEDDKELLTIVRAQVPYHLKNSALMLHEQAVKLGQRLGKIKNKKKKSTLEEQYKKQLMAANDLYGLFFQWYPEHKDFPDLAFNYGNIKFEFQNFTEAIDIYSTVARLKGKNQQSAAYNAVMAAYSLSEQKKGPKLPVPGKAIKAIPLPAPQNLLIKQIDFFVQNFPKANETISSQYTAAQLLFDYGHYEDSFTRFKVIARKSPKTAEGENSMRTVLSFYWEQENWPKVVSIAKEFILVPSIISAGHEKFLEETLNYAQSQAAISKK